MRRRLKSLVLTLLMLSAFEIWNHISPAGNGLDFLIFQSMAGGTASPSEALRNVSLLTPYPISMAFVPVVRVYEKIEKGLGLR